MVDWNTVDTIGAVVTMAGAAIIAVVKMIWNKGRKTGTEESTITVIKDDIENLNKRVDSLAQDLKTKEEKSHEVHAEIMKEVDNCSKSLAYIRGLLEGKKSESET